MSSAPLKPITTQLKPRLHCDGAMMKEAFVDICLRRVQVTLSTWIWDEMGIDGDVPQAKWELRI
jgi:hypothetical protein